MVISLHIVLPFLSRGRSWFSLEYLPEMTFYWLRCLLIALCRVSVVISCSLGPFQSSSFVCFCQWIQGEETEMINIHSEVGTLFNRPHINFLFSEFSVSTQKETADTNTDIFQKNVLSPSVYFSTVNIIKTLYKDLVFLV